jgi:bifunctional oligoribonuclease and PAP phosphatase NrnA
VARATDSRDRGATAARAVRARVDDVVRPRPRPSVAVTAVASPVAPVALRPDDIAAVPPEVVERLLRAERVMTVCHRDPEADALGSALGLALALEALGKRATPVCADPVPGMYDFMPRIERVLRAPEADLDPDLLVVLDCGELERVGPLLESHAGLFASVPILDIDHHVSNPRFGAVDWVDAAAAATCEMVTLLLPRLGLPFDVLDGAVASNLLAGVVIDTANFQHPNTTPRTLRVASELLAAGAPLPEIARRIYRTKPNEQLRLFGRVLGRMEASEDGRLVWSVLAPDDLEASGARAEHSEGLIDLLAQSQSGEVAILFKDQGAHTRLSVRTREGGVDATAITAPFGGGGHARAAGAAVERPYPAAREEVLAIAARLLRDSAEA